MVASITVRWFYWTTAMVDIRNRPHRPTRGPAIQLTGDVGPRRPSSAGARILRPIVPGPPASPSQFDTAPNPASTVPQVQPAAPVAPNPFLGFQPQVSPVAIVPAPPVIPPLQPAPQVAVQQEAQQAFAGVQPAGVGANTDANAILARGQALAAAQAGQPSGIPQAVRRGLGLGDVLPVGGGQREFRGANINQGNLIGQRTAAEGSGIGGGRRNLVAPEGASEDEKRRIREQNIQNAVGIDFQGNPISQFQLIQQRNISAGSERVEREQARERQNILLEGARRADLRGDPQSMAALVTQAAQTEIPGIGPARALQDLQGEDPLAALTADPASRLQLLKNLGAARTRESIEGTTTQRIKATKSQTKVKGEQATKLEDQKFKNRVKEGLADLQGRKELKAIDRQAGRETFARLRKIKLTGPQQAKIDVAVKKAEIAEDDEYIKALDQVRIMIDGFEVENIAAGEAGEKAARTTPARTSTQSAKREVQVASLNDIPTPPDKNTIYILPNGDRKEAAK